MTSGYSSLHRGLTIFLFTSLFSILPNLYGQEQENSPEISTFEDQLEALQKKHHVPVEVKTILSRQDFETAFKNWVQKETPSEDTPFSLLAVICHANKPEVRIHSRVFHDDIDSTELTNALQKIEKSSSNVSETKISLQIILKQLEDELPFTLQRAAVQTETAAKEVNIYRSHQNQKLKRLILKALSIGLISLLLGFAIFRYFQHKELIFPTPSWKSRLGAPYSGGNYAMAEKRSKKSQHLSPSLKH